MWAESMSELNMTNHTGDIVVSAGSVMAMMVAAPEVFYTDTELQGAIALPSHYATDVPEYFMDSSTAESSVRDITFGLISDASATTASDKVEAIRKYLAEYQLSRIHN